MEIGQKIYLKPINNAARRSKEIKEVTICKIGRKYFEVSEMKYTRFHIDSLTNDSGEYSADYQGYLSRQEIEDEREQFEIYNFLKQKFNSYRPTVSLEKLRMIKQIIE